MPQDAHQAGVFFLQAENQGLQGFALLDCAGVAGALAVDDGVVGADLGAQTAVDALGLVYHRVQVVLEGYSALGADVLTAVSKTAAADIGDRVAAGGALVAGYVDDLDNVGVIFVTAHSDTDALGGDGTLLMDTAAHSGVRAGGQVFGDGEYRLAELVSPFGSCHFAQDLVFEMLDLGVKFSRTHIYIS